MKGLVSALLCLSLGVAAPLAGTNVITADAAEEYSAEPTAETTAEPRLLTTISIDVVEGSYNTVRATAKNSFTLFSSTVEVHLYLYSSLIYTENISKMTQEAYSFISDLDQGEELIAEAATSGQQKYWRAYMKWQSNEGGYNYGQTETRLFDEYGCLIDNS